MRLYGFVAGLILTGICCSASAQMPYPSNYLAQGMPQPRQVAPPKYGEVRTIFGEAMLVVEKQAQCAKPSDMLQPGVCFTNALQAMRTGGLSQAAVMVVPFGQADGPVTGPIFDVVMANDKPSVTARAAASTSVAFPRACATLPGEPPRITLETRGSLRVAQEHQLAVCGGAAPRPPYRATLGPIPAAAPAPGVKTVVQGPTWPTAGTKLTLGTVMPLASSVSDCPPEAVLRDGLCFAQAVAQLNANPGLKDVVMLGTPNTARPGTALSDTAQYEIKLQGGKFTAHKRLFKRGLLGTEDGCDPTGPLSYAVGTTADGLTATPQQEVYCGPPEAPRGMALWEYYGDTVFVAMPGGRCPANERLLGGGVCFSPAIDYLKTSGDQAVQVIMLDYSPPLGASVPLSRVSNLRLRADTSFQTFTTEQFGAYEDGIRQPAGCQVPPGGVEASKGIVVEGYQRGRFYRQYQCPER